MGAWGTGILSDDTVRDVFGDYIDLFNRGKPPKAIQKEILGKYEECLLDQNDRPLVWIAIAKAQWDCGHLQPTVLSKIEQIVTQGLGLELWAEQGNALLQRRKTVLRQFLAKLESKNPRPRKPRMAIKRKPIFQPGDCIAVRLEDGEWGAILVLKGKPESDDPYVETYGTNLAGMLDYKSSRMPALSDFEKRNWLIKTHHFWRNEISLYVLIAARFRQVKDRFIRVGNVPLKAADPREAKTYASWPNIADDMYLQDRWNRGLRD
jgi:hypothetical protein